MGNKMKIILGILLIIMLIIYFEIEVLYLISGSLVIIVLLLNGFVTIPAYHFGVWSIFRHRVRGSSGILREGPSLVIPLISSIEPVSMALVKKEIKFSFTTKDGFYLGVEGVFQYRPDPDVSFPKGHPDEGRNVFVTVSEEVIFAGVTEAVEARIGGIGGKYDHEAFIESRPALGDIINSILRLERPPHMMHKKGKGVPKKDNIESWTKDDWYFCGKSDCKYDKPINAEKLIEFYNYHWPEIRIIKANEKALVTSRSEIELRYGIDVETFDLGSVIFTDETKKALEEGKQAEARAEAADKRIEIAKRFRKEIGTSAQISVDEADLLLDPEINKKIISIQGEVGVLGGILALKTKEGN